MFYEFIDKGIVIKKETLEEVADHFRIDEEEIKDGNLEPQIELFQAAYKVKHSCETYPEIAIVPEDVDILSCARLTKLEVSNYLRSKNYVIYKETEQGDFIENYVGCCGDEEEAAQVWNDFEKVDFNGTKYRIEYIL